MDNSIYATLSRQLALFRDMDVTANNIANANTGGYNAEHILFNSYVTKDINKGNKNDFAMADNLATYRNTENGPIHITGNDLDVAIQGNGYFQAETPLGIRYTRAGSFHLDDNSTLVTSEGYPVLSTNGQHIVFPQSATEIKVGEAGNITVNGDDFDSISVMQFENPQLMERLASGFYKSNVAPVPATDSRVVQGAIEESNVQPVIELTHMVAVERAATDTATMVSALYDLERKTSDTWAQQS